MKNLIIKIGVGLIVLGMTITSQASLISLPSAGIGLWTFAGNGTLIDLEGNNSGITSHSFVINTQTTINIVADDCCIGGDEFGLVLDGYSTPWTFSDTLNSINGVGLFHGVYTGVISPGTHSFSLAVTQDCCKSGGLSWGISQGEKLPELIYISPVPEPTTWAMMLAGLGLLGFVGRRNKNNGA